MTVIQHEQLPTDRQARPGCLPDEGQTDRCLGCDAEILWSFDDPDARSDNPFGLWVDQGGRDICPARPEDAACHFFHTPGTPDFWGA